MILRSRALTVALGLAITVGVGLRAWMLRGALATPDADEAMWTLMSRHVLNGEFPAYFWGQAYGGTIEVYLATPFVWAFGGDVTAARVLLLLLGTVAALLVYVVGRRVVGSWRATVAAAIFWMWPAYTAFKSTRVNGFYLSGQILVLLVLLLVLRLAERPKRVDAVAIGFVLGLAAWQTLQVLPIVLPALAWLAWRALRRTSWRCLPCRDLCSDRCLGSSSTCDTGCGSRGMAREAARIRRIFMASSQRSYRSSLGLASRSP